MKTLILAALLVATLPGLALAQSPADEACNSEPSVTDEAEYPVGRDTVTTGATVVTPGAVIDIDGDDWSCDTTVQVTAVSATGTRQTLGTARVGADGSFTLAVVIPETVDDTVTIEVAGTDLKGAQRVDTVDLKVQAAGTVGASTFTLGEELPVDEDSAFPLWLVVLGVGAFGAGATIVLRGRAAAQV